MIEQFPRKEQKYISIEEKSRMSFVENEFMSIMEL